MRGRLSTLLFGVLLCTGPAQGQTPPPAFTSEAHRQFDFWLGDWEVDGGTDGKTPVGKSSSTRVAKGCAIHENWRSANGGDGHSLNALDPATGQWNQFWVGADGVILRLAGGIEDGAMVLGGTVDLADGKAWPSPSWRAGPSLQAPSWARPRSPSWKPTFKPAPNVSRPKSLLKLMPCIFSLQIRRRKCRAARVLLWAPILGRVY